MLTIFVNIIIATTFHSSMLVCWKTRARYLEIPYQSRDLNWRPFSEGFGTCKGISVQQKIISFCNFAAQELECMACCPMLYDKLCVVHWLLSKYREYIIVETNYEAFYKMMWGTFIDLKILPVSYLFLCHVLPNIRVTLFGGMTEYTEYYKIRNIWNTLKHGICRIFCIWFELDWQKSRGKEYSVVLCAIL